MGASAVKKPGKSPAPDAAAPVAADPTRWIIFALLIGATLAAFWPVCTSDFTTWDDYANVAKNPLLNPVTLDGLFYFWRHAHMSIYIPLTYTVWAALALIARVGTPDPSGIWLNASIFHTANLLVHLAAALLAYQLLLALVRKRWAALAGALLFALHPVQVESVAWVAGMKDVLCGALSLAALWQYVLYAQSSNGSGATASLPSASRRRVHYAVATAFFVLAMLAKPSAMTVPILALILDRLLIGRSWKRIALALWPWLILSVACAIMARVSQTVAAPADGGRLWARPLLGGQALAFYLCKIVWPAKLAVQYHQAPAVILAGRWVWFAWVIPAAVALLAWMLRKREPWIAASAALLAAATLPVLGLVPFEFERLSLVADHYLYLAMIGPALAVAFLLAKTRHRFVFASICCVWLIALGVRSYFQTWYWQDTQTLFHHALAVNPDSQVAYNNLADRAVATGHLELAEQLSRQSILLQPNQPDAYVTLGSALHHLGRSAQALAAYQRAVDLAPDNAIALNDLAGALADQGKLTEAIPLARRALAQDPLLAAAHRNLAVMLAHQGQLPQALQEAQAAVRLDPVDPEAQINLAALLAAAGRRNEAIDHAQQALRLQPDSPKARGLLQSLAAPRR